MDKKKSLGVDGVYNSTLMFSDIHKFYAGESDRIAILIDT